MRSISTLMAALLALVGLSDAAKIKVDKNLALKLEGVRAGGDFYTAASTVFTVDNQNNTKGQIAKTIVDLSFDDIYVPSGDGTKGSIVCKDTYKCTEGEAKSCEYMGIKVSCNAANSLLRFKQGDAQSVNDVPTLDFKLLTPDTIWTSKFGNNGVLGLSPKSPFWAYLDKAYEPATNFDLSYKLDLKSDQDMYSLTRIELDDAAQLTMNGRLEDTEMAFSDFDAKYGAWVWKSAKVSLTSGKPNTSMPICIDNSVNTFFMANDVDYKNLKETVLKQLCSIEDGKEYCLKADSEFSNVDDMAIIFEGNNKKSVSVDMGAFDFIHYDEQNRAQFGIQPLNASKLCNGQQGIDFAVGRLFFLKAELTIRSLGQGKFQLGVATVRRPQMMILVILLVIVGIVLIIGIGTIAYTQLPRDPKKEQDEYEEAPETPISPEKE
jgi:hypothetical protein